MLVKKWQIGKMRTDSLIVSVILPTFNRSHLLTRAVQSVLRQTLSCFELIIVDDGSTDATADLISKLSDRRISFIKLSKNCGASYARNIGIENSRAKFIAFLDSDDEWHSTKLESQVALLNSCSNPSASIVYCLYNVYVNKWGTLNISIRPTKIYQGDIFESLLKGQCDLTTSTLLIKRSSLINIGGFDANLPSYQDTDLLLRLAESGNHFLAIREILVDKHCNIQNLPISNDLIAKSKGFEIFQHKWGLIIETHFGSAVYHEWCAQQYLYLNILYIKKMVGNNNKIAALHCILTSLKFASFSRHFVRFLLFSLIYVLLGESQIYKSMYEVGCLMRNRDEPIEE